MRWRSVELPTSTALTPSPRTICIANAAAVAHARPVSRSPAPPPRVRRRTSTPASTAPSRPAGSRRTGRHPTRRRAAQLRLIPRAGCSRATNTSTTSSIAMNATNAPNPITTTRTIGSCSRLRTPSSASRCHDDVRGARSPSPPGANTGRPTSTRAEATNEPASTNNAPLVPISGTNTAAMAAPDRFETEGREAQQRVRSLQIGVGDDAPDRAARRRHERRRQDRPGDHQCQHHRQRPQRERDRDHCDGLQQFARDHQSPHVHAIGERAGPRRHQRRRQIARQQQRGDGEAFVGAPGHVQNERDERQRVTDERDEPRDPEPPETGALA